MLFPILMGWTGGYEYLAGVWIRILRIIRFSWFSCHFPVQDSPNLCSLCNFTISNN